MTRPRSRAAGRIAVLLSSLALGSGCFQYSQVPVASLEPGADVRAQVSGVGVERLRREGELKARVLDGFAISGVVKATRGDSVLLSVPTTYYEGDFRARTLTQEVLLSRQELTGAEVRRLNRTRTTVVAAGVGAAAIAAVLATRRGAGASGGIPVHGGPAESRLPIGFHWPF